MDLPSPRRMPIRIRLALAYALFLVLTFGMAGVIVLTTLAEGMMRQVDVSLGRRADRVEQQLRIGLDGTLDRADAVRALADVQHDTDLTAPVIWDQLLDNQGTVLASAPDLTATQLPPTHALVVAALTGQEGSTNLKVGADRVRVLARPIRSDTRVVGVLLVAESLHVLDETYNQAAFLLAIAAVTAALAAIAGGWWLTGRSLGPVAAVTAAARGIAATGQFEQRISLPPARDELQALVATFNEMLARLAKTLQRQREFVGDAAHELRGPLTVIRGNLDLLRLDLPEEERQLSVDDVTSEVDRMSRLVGDLLVLAEVGADRAVRHEPVALDETVLETWRRAKTADADAHRLELVRNDPATVKGDRDLLSQLLGNLVRNALRYTPNGGTVRLSLENQGPVAELRVADTGIGIAPEHLSRVFERFYQVEKSAGGEKQGSGLGLAIVQEIAQAHGGTVQVRSEVGVGSTFTVVLPTANRDAKAP